MITQQKSSIDSQVHDALHASKLNHHAQTVRDLQHYIRGYTAAGGNLKMRSEDIDEALDYAYMLLLNEKMKIERPLRN